MGPAQDSSGTGAAHSVTHGSDAAALPFCVVGIGASAGGLEAAKQFAQGLAPDAGMAYMLILHLPPSHESMLAEIVGRVATVPVTPVSNGVRVERNHMYVLPAGHDLEIHGGALKLTPRRAATGQHRPIDHYFQSLADYQGEKSIGVVLSGTGSDGTIGIQEIKAAGGMTFAQDDTAEQTSMPRSAIATGAVDFVLPPVQIAAELARISGHPFVAAESEQTVTPADVTPVLDLIQTATGVDFSNYKRNTLYRRIVRRIVLRKLDGMSEYLRYLQANRGEIDALYQDILINVTSFFRNPAAFDALKSDVFAKLAEDRSRHDPVRIWTLGCSTGEEAYSVGMAFTEFVEELGRQIPLQIFATDLSLASIDKARMGVYPPGSVQDISKERLRRFFVEVDGKYQIAKSIRDACVFARHNALSDPPFSRIDLVSCRNMLIYLGTELQQKVIPILHYALRPNGFLWLGTSATIGGYRDLFELVNVRHKIYARKPARAALPLGTVSPLRGRPFVPGTPVAIERGTTSAESQKEIDRLLISRYAPPSVIVREDLEILQYRGETGPYLSPTPGRASLNLLKMVRDDLLLGVRSAVQRAKDGEMPVRQEGLRLRSEGQERVVAVEVTPIKTGVQRADTFMIVFEDTSARALELRAHPLTESGTSTEEAEKEVMLRQEIERLKQELAATREYLQSVIEQQEAANEELQSANEEVHSANEELQSINEELETSKEEVQSSNEELATVNDELHARNLELAQSNNDLLNLLASVQMAIVMLGPNMCIRRFTPTAEKLFNLIPTDVGRPVSDIKMNFEVPDLDELVTEVMDSMSVRELEVRDKQGRWYLLRVRPYRTMENKIDGALIVLVDVDSLKRNEELLRQQTELLNQAHEPILMWYLDGGITYWNKAAEDTYGFTRDQALGRGSHDLLHTSPPYADLRPVIERHRYWTGELVHTRRDGQKIIVESRMVVVRDPGGRDVVVEAIRPITERKETERILRRRADDLVTADRHKDEFLAMLAHELRSPLAPLRNVVTLLRSSSAKAADKERMLQVMDRQIHNMARLIDDLLDVSRMTLSQITLRTQPCELAELLRRATEQNEPTVQAKHQSVHLSVPLEPVHVLGDPIRLEQIVTNLVSNASKYTPEGGEIWASLALEISADGDREAVVVVKDNGIGIGADMLPHVFDLFMRATRSIDQKYGGLGVGLTLVRRLTELHGGTVYAHSDGQGKGSTFTVRLPALPQPLDHASPLAQAAEKRNGNRRVLVVDDTADHADTLGLLLSDAGHTVRTARSGAEAIELAAEFKPDVAIVDIGMPEMDGYEVARRLKALPDPDRRLLIALSGYGQADVRQRALDAGFDEYVVKPVEAQKILDLLES